MRPVANLGCADRRAVDARIGLDINAVADPHRARLRNLLPVPGIVLRKPETIGADNRAVLERHVVPKNASFAHYRVRMGKEVAARLHARIENHVRQQGGVRPQPHVRPHHHIGADMRALADLGRRINDRGRMDPRGGTPAAGKKAQAHAKKHSRDS